MTTFALSEVRNRFSELIDRVDAGEVITITRRGTVVLQLIPPGAAREQIGLDAVSALTASRKGVSLGTVKSRELIRHGRR